MTALRQLIDETTGHGRQDYQLTRVYRLGEYTVRLRIRRDFYEFQSHAVAEVLTPLASWTELITTPASGWHAHTTATADFEALGEIADDLIRRAAAILVAGETLITTTPDRTGPVRRITDRQELVYLAAELGMRPDWHEPDSRDVTAEVGGSTFDNAGFWPTESVTVNDPQHELFVRLVQDGEAVADVNLATLFAWATGHTTD